MENREIKSQEYNKFWKAMEGVIPEVADRIHKEVKDLQQRSYKEGFEKGRQEIEKAREEVLLEIRDELLEQIEKGRKYNIYGGVADYQDALHLVGGMLSKLTMNNMSQNNYTLIKQTKKNRYEVSNRDVDTDDSGKVYVCKTLKKAVEMANKLEKECYLESSEYGIRIKLLKE